MTSSGKRARGEQQGSRAKRNGRRNKERHEANMLERSKLNAERKAKGLPPLKDKS